MALTLNTGHALHGNLLAFICVSDGALADIKTARTFTPGSGTSYGSGTYGAHFRTAGSGFTVAGATWTPTISTDSTSGAFTLFLVFNAVTTIAAGQAGFMQATASGALNAQINPARPGQGDGLGFGTGTLSASGACSVAVTRPAGDATNMSAYVNGALSVAAAGGFGQASALSGFGGNSAGASIDANVVYCIVFDKVLTSTEISDLHASLGASNAFAMLDAPSTPILTAPTSTPTGNTTANAGATIDTVSGSGSRILYALPRVGGSAASAATIIATGTQLPVTTSGAKSVPLAGLTTNVGAVADLVYVDATLGQSNVVTTPTFTPPTMASSGSLAAQSGTASTAFTWTGATPESQITQQGVGASAWTLNSAGGSGLTTINSSTGVPGGTLTATPGVYTVTVTKTDSSTAGTNPTGGGAPPQTIVRTASVTVASGGGGGTAPSITTQPTSQSVTEGATATFTVSATGTGLTYQWRRNGTNIGAATASSYTTPATTVSGGAANNGDLYSVVVTGDTAPPATSSNATLTVNAATGTYTAQTDIVAVAGIAMANTLVYTTWCPSGRPGSITSPVNSSTTTDSAGRATISHTVAGDGFVVIGTRPGPVVGNDRVFAQFLTLA